MLKGVWYIMERRWGGEFVIYASKIVGFTLEWRAPSHDSHWDLLPTPCYVIIGIYSLISERESATCSTAAGQSLQVERYKEWEGSNAVSEFIFVSYLID